MDSRARRFEGDDALDELESPVTIIEELPPPIFILSFTPPTDGDESRESRCSSYEEKFIYRKDFGYMTIREGARMN